MKFLFLSIFAILAAPQANAASVRLNPEESFKVVEAFLLADVKANQSKPVYTIRINDLACKARYVSHAGSPEDVLWGMHEYECSNPKVTGAAAKGIFDTLDALQNTYGEKILITDCGMGKCVTSLKKIDCRIKSEEYETAKRFFCTLTDGN